MILISSCLIGAYVRYDGGSQGDTRLIELINEAQGDTCLSRTSGWLKCTT